jgi:hypothetical protein
VGINLCPLLFHPFLTPHPVTFPFVSKLSLDNLAKGIEFYSPESAELFISFTDDNPHLIANFIAKYEEHMNIMILRHDTDGFIFKIEASSQKEIARICDIMLEDIDVTSLEIL